MSVDFSVIFAKGRHRKTKNFHRAPCFGKLKELDSLVMFETGAKDTWGKPYRVKYWPEVHCEREAAEAWFQYLIDHPLWGAYLVKPDASVIGTGSIQGARTKCVTISCEANPHQLLNTLSMFRKPHIYPQQVKLWYDLVNEGANPDAAAVSVMLLYVTADKVYPAMHEDGEHAVFSRKTIGVDELRLYVSYRTDGVASLDYYKEGVDSYKEYMRYERNGEFPVTGWIVSYRDPIDTDDRLENKLIPCDYDIIYDKQEKKVISMTRKFRDIRTSDLSGLVSQINSLAGV